MGIGGQRRTLAAYPRERDPVDILEEAGWAPEPVYSRSLAGIRSLDTPTRSESFLSSG
jgi:hypothetical protein